MAGPHSSMSSCSSHAVWFCLVSRQANRSRIHKDLMVAHFNTLSPYNHCHWFLSSNHHNTRVYPLALAYSGLPWIWIDKGQRIQLNVKHGHRMNWNSYRTVIPICIQIDHGLEGMDRNFSTRLDLFNAIWSQEPSWFLDLHSKGLPICPGHIGTPK